MDPNGTKACLYLSASSTILLPSETTHRSDRQIRIWKGQTGKLALPGIVGSLPARSPAVKSVTGRFWRPLCACSSFLDLMTKSLNLFSILNNIYNLIWIPSQAMLPWKHIKIFFHKRKEMNASITGFLQSLVGSEYLPMENALDCPIHR